MAPSLPASSSLSGTMSTATMSGSGQPRPLDAGQPHTSAADDRDSCTDRTSAVLRTAPTPVATAQPTRARRSSGASLRTFDGTGNRDDDALGEGRDAEVVVCWFAVDGDAGWCRPAGRRRGNDLGVAGALHRSSVAAVATLPAAGHPGQDHVVAYGEVADAGPDGRHDTGSFMPQHGGDGHRPFPLDHMQV